MTKPVSVTGYAGREARPGAWSLGECAILGLVAGMGQSAADAALAVGRSKSACVSKAKRLGFRFTARAGRKRR